MRQLLMLSLLLTITASIQFAEPRDNIGFSGLEMYKFNNGIDQLHVSDINGDSLNDIILVNNMKARIELLLNGNDPSKQDPAKAKETIDNINVIKYSTRFYPETIPVTAKVYSLCISDINRDNKHDILFAGRPGGLYVYTQKDNGKFKKKYTIEISNLLYNNFSVCSTTIAPDGPLFLITLCRDRIELYNTEDKTPFANPQTIPLEDGFTNKLQDFKVTDFNGDGLRDLIFMTPFQKPSLRIRFQTEDSTFGPIHCFDLDKYRSLEFYDTDGNGRPELFYIQTISGRVILSTYIHAKKPTKKNQFSNGVFYPYPSAQSKKRDLALGDLNNDKRTDVIITEPDISAVSTFIQNPFYRFNRFRIFPSLINANTIIVRDILPQKGNEVLVFSKDENILGISTPGDNFTLSFPAPVENVQGQVSAVALADIDGDKKEDLIYTASIKKPKRSRAVFVHSGNMEQGFSNAFSKITPDNPFKTDPEDITVFDADSNGLSDIIVFVPYEKHFRIFLQSEKGEFSDITSAKGFNSGIIEKVKKENFSVIDYNNDGHKEFIITRKNFARILRINKNNRISILEQINSPLNGHVTSVIPIRAGEDSGTRLLLHDSKFDKLLILKKNQNSLYHTVEKINVENIEIEKIFTPDLDSDENEDILIKGEKKFGIFLRAQPANRIEIAASYETRIKKGRYGFLKAGDFTADGSTELVLLEQNHHVLEFLSARDSSLRHILKFKVFETGPQTSQRAAGRSGSQSRNEPREIGFGDINNDGLPDLITIVHDRVITYIQQK